MKALLRAMMMVELYACAVLALVLYSPILAWEYYRKKKREHHETDSGQ